MVDIKLKDIIVVIIALIIGYIAFGILLTIFGLIWFLTIFIIRVLAILIIAYIAYLLLKKLL